MKRLRILMVMCLCIVSIEGCFGGENALLKISDLKSEYKKSDIVTFELKNNSEGKILYGVTLEKYTDDKWIEVVPNIEGPYKYSKSFRLLMLKASESKKLLWPNKGSLNLFKPAFGRYRFVVFYYLGEVRRGQRNALKSTEFFLK